MERIRLTLRHVPRLVAEELQGVPPERLLAQALRLFRRRFGWCCVDLVPVDPEGRTNGHDETRLDGDR